MKPLRELVPDAKYPIRLVQADLSKPKTWEKAVKRCTYVFHVASPFPAGATNEAVIVKTAVEGTTCVLKACAEAGTVKRVVVTSSIAAVSAGSVGNPSNPPDYVYTEKDWAEESVCTPYIKSKLKAEQAAWDLVKNLEEGKQFELAVVNPGYVQGPLLSASSGEGSKEFCQRLLNNKMPGIPDVTIAVVDVRDVAAAHIAAMEKSEAAGNRYLLSSRTINFREYGVIIGNEFRPQGYKIPSRNLPKMVMWLGKFFDSGLKQIYSSVGKHVQVSNERMVNELGIQPRPVEESIIDACYSLIDLGLAKKTPGYLGHPSTRPPPPEPQTTEETPAAKEEGQEKTEGEKAEGEKAEGEKTEGEKTEGEKTEETPPAQTEDKPAESQPSESQATSDEGQKTEEEKPAESEAQPATEKTESEPAPEEKTESEPAPEEKTESEPAVEVKEESEPAPQEKTEDEPAPQETSESERAAEETPKAAEEPAEEKTESDPAPQETSESEPAPQETSEPATEETPKAEEEAQAGGEEGEKSEEGAASEDKQEEGQNE